MRSWHTREHNSAASSSWSGNAGRGLISATGDEADILSLSLKRLPKGCNESRHVFDTLSSADPAMWVKARQYTGRIVTVSNAKVFDEPVFNYTLEFPYLWEEMTIPIPYKADWHGV